jgi:D-alanyl-D-alanine carboxypeptidase/D-alanyl-D-alanine-endopeptidase (penicillin-binding protein 4)
MKKAPLFLLFAATGLLTVHGQSLQTFVQEKQQLPVLEGAIWGGIAAYAEQPLTPLFALNEQVRLTPASTLKLLTTAAALETFGPDYRFQTRLYASARPDENGILNGDLYLRGGADPTLGSTRVTGAETWRTVANQWATAVQKAGIKQINGAVYADISLFEGPSVAPKVNWENMGNYYAAPVSPICFNDNSFEIHFAPQIQPGQPVKVAYTLPEVPGLQLKSFVTADGKSDKDNAYVYGAPGQYELNIFGTIPTSMTGFKIKAALPDPALFAAQVLQTVLQEKSITVSQPPQTISDPPDYNAMQLLHTYYSPKLKDIVVIVNKRSFNLYADMLLRMLAVQAGKSGSLQNGLDELKNFLLKNKIAAENDTVLHDGSGLARDNLLTPQVLLNTLIYMSNSPYFKEYYTSLATPDDRGDLLLLRKFLKPQKRIEQVRVKGGTIDSVKAAAGYVQDRNGQLIAFVMIANNLAGKDESLWRFHEDIIKRLISLPQDK